MKTSLLSRSTINLTTSISIPKFKEQEIWMCSFVTRPLIGKSRTTYKPALILKSIGAGKVLVATITHTNGSKHSFAISSIRAVSATKLYGKVRTVSKTEWSAVKKMLVGYFM